MKAIALRKGSDNVELIEVEKPVPQPDEVLIKVIRCGICGTDREIIKRKIPDVPPGQDYLIIGHEVLGRVVELGKDIKADIKTGDLVSVLVRRSCENCNACLTGHVDHCYTGEYKERGIHKIHGFLTEYITDKPEHLIAVPPELEDLGALAEPISISAKAYQVAQRLMGRVCFDGACSLTGEKEKALVAGHGPIGMLAAMLLTVEGFDVSVLGRRKPGDFQREFVKSFDARYLDMSLDEDKKTVANEGGFFLIMEAVGLSELTFRLPELLSRNGILILTGVPRGPQEICFDGNGFMASLVRYNQTVTGTVNASHENFEAGLQYLQRFKETFPDSISKLITGRYNLNKWQDAFGRKSPDEIKAMIEFE